LFPKDEFRVQIAAANGRSRFLEYQPNTVELIASLDQGTARLRISLDLLEMLALIRNGYRPNPADLEGLFVNLLIFRNELLNLTFRQVVVTPDNEDLYEIRASTGAQAGIRLQLARYGAPASGSTQAVVPGSGHQRAPAV
jgi:hypothetical protein